MLSVKMVIATHRFLFLSFSLIFSVCANASFKDNSANERGMPTELYEGMIAFDLNSGNYFKSLVLMDEAYKVKYPISYAKALWGFHINDDANKLIALKTNKKNKKSLKPGQLFYIGEMFYEQGDCVNALKSLKSLKNKLPLLDKQKYAFYAANCFIKLGSDKRAAKVLTDILAGEWAAYAYYNLAISYAQGSRDKTKALAALSIAASLNGNKTKQQIELNDRIHLTTASLYLESGKNQSAIEFLKKVHLDSESSVSALYLNGLAHLELGDFRSANQSWVAAKKYSLVNASAAESILAVPYAFERSGYISQALEAYLEASSGFENELKLIANLDNALKKHGARKVLIDEGDIKGLEWFLASDIALNTTRASYYSYLVSEPSIYDKVERHSELNLLAQSLEFWVNQLHVFEGALKGKQEGFSKNKGQLDIEKIKSTIKDYKSRIANISASKVLSPTMKKNIHLDALQEGIDTINDRLALLNTKISKGKTQLINNQKEIKKLLKDIKSKKKNIDSLIAENDKHLTEDVRRKLGELKELMLSNYERAEQGLIHIFQGIAENKKNVKRKKHLGGR